MGRQGRNNIFKGLKKKQVVDLEFYAQQNHLSREREVA